MALSLTSPDALSSGLDALLFCGSLAVALLFAGIVAWPIDIWLIRRGRGHAVLHTHHGHEA